MVASLFKQNLTEISFNSKWLTGINLKERQQNFSEKFKVPVMLFSLFSFNFSSSDWQRQEERWEWRMHDSSPTECHIVKGRGGTRHDTSVSFLEFQRLQNVHIWRRRLFMSVRRIVRATDQKLSMTLTQLFFYLSLLWKILEMRRQE